MKKIMKKALSLILVLSLAIVPMTAMAAVGDTVPMDENLVNLIAPTSEQTVGAGETVYYNYQNFYGQCAGYDLTVKGAAGFDVSVATVDYLNGIVVASVESDENTGVVETNVSVGFSAMTVFGITNNTTSAQTYDVSLVEELGSGNNPAPLVFGETTVETGGMYGYTYSYDVAQDGQFTLAVADGNEDGWKYNIYINGNQAIDQEAWSTDSPVVPTVTIDVAANDELRVWVSTNETDMATYYDVVGDVTFSAYFEADVKVDSNANDGNGYDSLIVDTNDVVQNGTVNTTIYSFEPAETGTYKISAADGMVVSTYIGTSNYVGAVDKAPADFVEVTCTSVGQEFMIGVASSSTWVPTTQVTIEKTAEYIPPVEVQWTIYENETTPQAFDYKGGELEYVNIEDTTVDKAVLGTDGYYHLNSADGKILYVDLDDTALISLSDAAGYYGLKVIKTENGEVTEKISYNEAVLAYYECADAETGLYPLTKDLMDMLQAVGENQGWYAENGQVPVTTEDAWMFACYYEKTSTPATTPVKPAPDTGDSANAVVWAIVMVVAAGAAVVAFESKRRAR